MRNRHPLVWALCLAMLSSPLLRAADAPEKQSVFRQPRVQMAYARLQAQIQALFQKKDYAEGEKKCREAIALAPHYPDAHYNLACALARQGKKAKALDALADAIKQGFNRPEHIRKDADLESLRAEPRFVKLLDEAKEAKPLLLWPRQIMVAGARGGEVEVSEKNTAWDLRNGVFRCFFKLDPEDKNTEVVKGLGEAGNLIRKWYKEGTAAGNYGDLYDNHDGDHSNMNYKAFPQLTRIEFSKEAKDRRLHMGLQSIFFYNGVVLGNSSTALVGGPFWRSQPRLACINERTMRVLYNHYVSNHLYFYPEHRDHDAGHNGKDAQGKNAGYGDVYPANTPYLIISQGSSGSDRAFMDAVAATLAAFRPETKKALVKEGTLVPAVQMIFRSSNKNLKKPEDYLTGKAHPTVFEGKNLDVVKMVKAAHEIKADELPPMVQLRVVKEDRPLPGRDVFDAEERGEKLFDTPCAIARVLRSSQRTRRLVISAEKSRDANKRPLTWQWVLLRGDPKAVTIKPLNKDKSVVELTVSWFERRPVEPGSDLESNRVDVGIFVHNGKHYSAPGFVTFFAPDNQKRVYNKNGQIESIDYAGAAGNYSDPLADMPKDWRDEYHHDQQGRLTGWTRIRGKEKQEFTADGALVLTTDARGRPLTARTVTYAAKGRKGKAPLLEQKPGDEVLRYEYTSDEDRVGRPHRDEGKTPGPMTDQETNN
jgi:Tetratricopeptide repeat